MLLPQNLKVFFLCFFFGCSQVFAHSASLEFYGNQNYELKYSKQVYKDYELNVRSQKFEKNFEGRAGTKICLIFCFTLPVEEKNLQIESYSVFIKKEFSDVFSDYDLGKLSAGFGISYDNVKAKTAGSVSTSGVSTNFVKFLINTEHKYPIEVFGKKFNIETFLEYGFFNQSEADVKEWLLKTQLIYDFKEDTFLSFGYKLRDIDINYVKEEEIIDLKGKENTIFVGVKRIW